MQTGAYRAAFQNSQRKRRRKNKCEKYKCNTQDTDISSPIIKIIITISIINTAHIESYSHLPPRLSWTSRSSGGAQTFMAELNSSSSFKIFHFLQNSVPYFKILFPPSKYFSSFKILSLSLSLSPPSKYFPSFTVKSYVSFRIFLLLQSRLPPLLLQNILPFPPRPPPSSQYHCPKFLPLLLYVVCFYLIFHSMFCFWTIAVFLLVSSGYIFQHLSLIPSLILPL